MEKVSVFFRFYSAVSAGHRDALFLVPADRRKRLIRRLCRCVATLVGLHLPGNRDQRDEAFSEEESWILLVDIIHSKIGCK